MDNGAEDLLKYLIDYKKRNELSQYIDKLYTKKTEEEINSVLGYLRDNGLISCTFADDRVYYADLTYKGLHYFDDATVSSEKATVKSKKLFISHSTNDAEYVKAFVMDLLVKLGLTPKEVFCSSVPGFGVSVDHNIVKTMYEQFQKYDLHMIYMLSGNYYASPYCLNEMGAAWILETDSSVLLLPGFKHQDVRGVVDSGKLSISFDSNDDLVRGELNQFKDNIIKEFNLREIDETLWENIRDSFIKTIRSIRYTRNDDENANVAKKEDINISGFNTKDEKLLLYYIISKELRTVDLKEYGEWLVDQEIFDTNIKNGSNLLADYGCGSVSESVLVLDTDLFRVIMSLSKTEVNELNDFKESKRELSNQVFKKLYSDKCVPNYAVLLLAYLQDYSSSSLDYAWQTQYEIEGIKSWEDSKKLVSGCLSSNYEAALSFLIEHKMVHATAYTSHGNVKEYQLNKSLSEELLGGDLFYTTITRDVKSYYNKNSKS